MQVLDEVKADSRIVEASDSDSSQVINLNMSFCSDLKESSRCPESESSNKSNTLCPDQEEETKKGTPKLIMIDTKGQGNVSNRSEDYQMEEDCFEELLNDIEACHK